MASLNQKSLKTGLNKASKSLEEAPARKKGTSARTVERTFLDERAELLKDIPPHVIKKAWFTLAHTLLDPNAQIIDAGCADGMMTYVMAVLNPEAKVTGIDIDPETIKQAKKNYSHPNLTYKVGNIFDNIAPPNSTDVIVNSFVLHEIYSASHYSERLISETLEAQYKALKNTGVIIIRDHLMPPPGEFVLLEFKDTPGGNDVNSMSEADLLEWYSDNARTRDIEAGGGFFIEELPPNYPKTRLFRVPAKWAWEFILRKDNRDRLQEELSKEYAFFTEQDFRKELRSLGARVTYTAPHWDEGFIQSRVNGHVRLYKEDGSHLGPPPTSHIIIAEKTAQKTSLILQERRATRARAGSLYLRTVKDERSGQISDIVSRDLEIAEVIPYRVTPEGELKVYLHEDLPRGLTNAVPRTGKNLDGRRWSGHMIEALALPAHDARQAKEDDSPSSIVDFAMNRIGVKPSLDSRLQNGPGFYPDPYRIDERIETYYFRVETFHPEFEPKETLYDLKGFSSRGRMRELDAQAVLNALAVGYLPNSRLEVQLLALFEMTQIRHQVWSDMPLQLSEVPIEEVMDLNKLKSQMAHRDDRFKEIRGSAGNIRLVQSVFVDEGRDEGGGITGLAARDMEFVVPEDNTLNTAVVLPLVRDLSGEVMAGVVTEYLPVPQRYSGTGMTMTLPSFPLPKDVSDVEAARLYIAERFKVDPKNVARMGESYFTHIGITPHRIYPFVVTNQRGGASNGGFHGVTSVTPLKDLWKLCYWDNHDSFMKCVGQAYQRLFNSDQALRNDFSLSMSDDLAKSRATESSVISLSNSLTTTAPSSSTSFMSTIAAQPSGEVPASAAISETQIVAPPVVIETAIQESSESEAEKDAQQDETTTSHISGPNDDVIGEDYKANNKPSRSYHGAIRTPKAPV